MDIQPMVQGPRPACAHSSILLNLEVVLLLAAIRDKTHEDEVSKMSEWERKIVIRVELVDLLVQACMIARFL